ncbi:PqqD family protein [uncultured Porphyromonas sp.]|uniref:PqqD family protein n=1 Tax=uncultured Porphyromonas sp. TaxID=159274 RepID=UPI0026383361|nr:PqqD family protein [uncultured Porphyromonas sp.]
MRIKDQISLRKIADEYIMIEGSGDSLDYTQAVSLNDSAAYLIESVRGKDFTLEDWVELLTDRYEVSGEQARADVELLIQMLKEAEIID